MCVCVYVETAALRRSHKPFLATCATLVPQYEVFALTWRIARPSDKAGLAKTPPTGAILNHQTLLLLCSASKSQDLDTRATSMQMPIEQVAIIPYTETLTSFVCYRLC